MENIAEVDASDEFVNELIKKRGTLMKKAGTDDNILANQRANFEM